VTLSFQLAADAHADIGVYDLSATRVRVLASRIFTAGSHQLIWDGKDDAAAAVRDGMYWVLLQTASETRAELVLKEL
jgi:flagellar hook assembly protein FlgD